jgi:hypothetical protein
MTKACVQMMGRMAYVWGWPLVYVANQRMDSPFASTCSTTRFVVNPSSRLPVGSLECGRVWTG